jgi:hypothetical protein
MMILVSSFLTSMFYDAIKLSTTQAQEAKEAGEEEEKNETSRKCR